MSAKGVTEDAEWSFLTFCRIRPPSLQSLSFSEKDQSQSQSQRHIQFRVSEWDEDKDKDSNLLQNGDADPSKSKSKKSGKVVALEIPQGADPGLVHNNPSGFVSFSFNEVFDIDATQDDVFNKIQPMVMDVFEGINSTVLAYGQTGSGKTYSICGGNTYAERGLIPRSIALVFEELAVRRENSEAHIRYKVLVSFTEVFGENLYDLLDPQKRNLPLEEWQKVQVLEGEDGLILRNINVFEVASEEEVLNLFFMGTTNRTISSTKMNDASSRSHAIFTMVVETEETIGNRKTFSAGKINLVDLAGSERLYKVNNSKNSIKEGKSINLSLHYLEQVIISLRDSLRNPLPSRPSRRASTRGSICGASGAHIPYRNSVLTNILRDSLGGNCKSCFLLTMASEVESFEESVSTGRFGQRCGEIQVKVHANLEVDVHSQLREARQRVHQLQVKVNHLEEEQVHFQSAIQARQRAIDEMTNVERPLTAQEEHDCENLMASLCGGSQLDIDAVTEIKGLSKSALLTLVIELSQKVRESRRQSSVSSDVSAIIDSPRARAILNRSGSVWSKTEDVESNPDDEAKSDLSDGDNTLGTPKFSHHRQQSDDGSLIESKTLDISLLVTQSKRVRQLLDGVTVITTGTFGNSKTKHLSISPDLKQLIWKDILNDTTKREDVESYKGFVIADTKPNGVVVKYEHNNKSKKMEIPRNNLLPEENRSRVLKWIELLNSLRDA